MSDRTSPAVLLGMDRLLGLQLARILWRHGIPTVGVAFDPGSHYCRTRAADLVVRAADFQQDPARVLSDLNRRYGARPVLIPCLDEFVWWLNDHRVEVQEHADFLLPRAEDLERLGDKACFYRYAMENDLPLPPTRFVRSHEALEAAAWDMTFPLVLKPPRRSPEWMEVTGGFKVLRIDDPRELLEVAPPLQAAVGELILQTWVEGGDDCMYSLFVCLDRQSLPVTPPLVARKLRQWPPDIGVGCLVEEVREEAIVETGLPILQELGYVGAGSLQFKRDAATEKFFLIEMNTRFALNFPLMEACGIEATLSHYCLAAGRPLPDARTLLRPGSKWICWKRDLASAYVHWRRGDLTPGEWLRSLRGRKRSAELMLGDPMPLLADLGGKLRRGLSGSARKTLVGGG